MKFVMARLADLTQPKPKDAEAETASEAPEGEGVFSMDQDFPVLPSNNPVEVPTEAATDAMETNSPLIRTDKDPLLGGYTTSTEETDDEHLLDSDNPIVPDWADSVEEEANPRYQT